MFEKIKYVQYTNFGIVSIFREGWYGTKINGDKQFYFLLFSFIICNMFFFLIIKDSIMVRDHSDNISLVHTRVLVVFFLEISECLKRLQCFRRTICCGKE